MRMPIAAHLGPPNVEVLARRFMHTVLNPAMLTLAGRPHWYAARLEHTGRRSGTTYATPITATLVDDGVVVPLVWGVHVDWLRNLQAAGEAVLILGGRRYRLTDPEVLTTAQAWPRLPREQRMRARLYRIGHWLHADVTPVGPAPVGTDRGPGMTRAAVKRTTTSSRTSSSRRTSAPPARTAPRTRKTTPSRT